MQISQHKQGSASLFAECNSKRNFVERVHPQVNRALSDDGPFCSHSKYPEITGPGTQEHRETLRKWQKW